MPFAFNYLARNSSSANTDAGKAWIYNGTSTGSNESLATISASGYFNPAQVTLKTIFAASSTGNTGSFAVDDIIQINGNDSTAIYIVTSVTTNVTVVAQGAPGAGTVTNIATGTGLTGGPITSTGTISLANIASDTVLANTTGGSAAPAATSISAIIDTIGGTQGDILYRNATTWTVLAPSTSGEFLTTGGASANPSWTAGNAGTITGGTALGGTYPIFAGVSGANLTFNGITLGTNLSGSITGGAFTINATVPAGFTWNAQSTGTVNMVAGNGYYITDSSTVTLTLPATAAAGTVMEVAGYGAGGWIIAQNALQQIFDGVDNTTAGTGGSLISTNQYDAVRLLCIVANTDWTVISSQGNLGFN